MGAPYSNGGGFQSSLSQGGGTYAFHDLFFLSLSKSYLLCVHVVQEKEAEVVGVAQQQLLSAQGENPLLKWSNSMCDEFEISV